MKVAVTSVVSTGRRMQSSDKPMFRTPPTFATPSSDDEHERSGLADLDGGRGHGDGLSSRKVSRTVTSVPGHRSSSVFGMVARTGTVPVVVSTVFSIIVTWPLAAARIARNDRLDVAVSLASAGAIRAGCAAAARR